MVAYYSTWQTLVGQYMTQSQTMPLCKQIDLDVHNPIRATDAIQHYASSQIIVQPAPLTSREIPNSIYNILDIPEIDFPESSLVQPTHHGPSTPPVPGLIVLTRK